MSAAERTNDSATKSAPELGGEREVGDVLLGDRRQLGPRVGDVDALARRQRAGRDRARDDLARRRRARRRSRGTPSPITISERSVTRRGEVGEVDEHPVGAGPAVGAGEDDRLAGLDRALARCRADRRSFGPCRSNSSAERPPRARGRRAHLGGAAAQVVGGAVRAVQPRAVEAGRDQPVEHPGGVGRRAQRGHDLRAPLEHARYPAACALVRLARGGMRSVIVPSAISAAKPSVSESVGWGWMVRPRSWASEPTSIACTASAISSPALGPTMPAPSSRRVPGSTRSFVRPSSRPWARDRPEAAHGNDAFS